jgi:hypothetical protein
VPAIGGTCHAAKAQTARYIDGDGEKRLILTAVAHRFSDMMDGWRERVSRGRLGSPIRLLETALPRFFFLLSSLMVAVVPWGTPATAAGVVSQAAAIASPLDPVNMATDGPTIELVAPKNGGIYTSPIGIEIAFAPKNGSSIDLSSLRVTVVSTTVAGVFELDITEDIIDYASQNGIKAANAEIPAGEHVVTIQVADSEQRMAERRLEITVREESVLERRTRD